MVDLLTIENRDAFFDALIKQRHAMPVKIGGEEYEGVFATHEEIPENREDWVHRVRFPGDRPYSDRTTEVVKAGECPITRADILEKEKAGAVAIRYYFPEEGFATFFDFFLNNPTLPEHETALNDALSMIFVQVLAIAPDPDLPKNVSLEDVLDKPERCPAGLGRKMLIRDSTYLLPLIEEPKLMLTIGIYMAAHTAWSDQMRLAIARNSDLTISEREVARDVLDKQLVEFGEMFIYPTLAPLVVRQRRKHFGPSHNTSSEQTTRMTHDENTVSSIAEGWERFFAAKMLVTDYGRLGSDGVPLESFCPVAPHLHRAQKNKVMEKIYERVCTQSAVWGKWVHRTQQILIQTCSPGYAEEAIQALNLKRMARGETYPALRARKPHEGNGVSR